MRRAIAIAGLFFAFASCNQKTQQKINHPLLDEMKWLIGTWYNVSAEGEFYEVWNAYRDSAYTGIGFLLVKGDTLFSEIISLEERNGELFYVPSISGQNAGQPVSFKLTSRSNGKYIFENKEHDFPQRIIYTNPRPDSLYACVEGMQDGILRKEEFALSRKK
jgi:hypothetical protein